MTVDGRQQDTTAAIRASDAHLGATSDTPTLHPPAFVDFPFTNPDATFADHLVRVRTVEPRLAVAPDIENGRTPETVIEQADQLARHAETVIIVPKSVHPSRVPDRFRVGVPLASFGSGAPWSTWDYRHCRSVHLLGGGPTRQHHAAACLSGVDSLDTSALGKLCRFGYWDSGTLDAPEDWDYRRRLRESLDNYVASWTHP